VTVGGKIPKMVTRNEPTLLCGEKEQLMILLSNKRWQVTLNDYMGGMDGHLNLV
jgi:hypothetical protein